MPTINDGDTINLPLHQVARVQIQGQDEVATPVQLEDQQFTALADTVYTVEAAPVVIVSSSVADPSVITTEIDHQLVTGDTVTIAGHSGSTPSINGDHVITKTGAKTFTIPVNVTVGGTGGSFDCPNARLLVPVAAGSAPLYIRADGDAGPNEALLSLGATVRVYAALATQLIIYYNIEGETRSVPIPGSSVVELPLNKVMRLRVEGQDDDGNVVGLTDQSFPDTSPKFTVSPTDPADPYSRLVTPDELGTGSITVTADGDPAPPAGIVSSSVANPSTITTAKPHGLTVPVPVIISGHSGSTPDINGGHVATPTGSTTFTIPVNVTVGGTGGTFVRTNLSKSVIIDVVPAVATQLVSSYDLENP